MKMHFLFSSALVGDHLESFTPHKGGGGEEAQRLTLHVGGKKGESRNRYVGNGLGKGKA